MPRRKKGDEDEAPAAAPAASAATAQKKGKGGKRRGGDSDEELDAKPAAPVPAAVAAAPAAASGLSGTAARRAKREAKKKGGAAEPAKGKAAAAHDDDDDDDDEPAEDDSDAEAAHEEAEEEIVRPPSSTFAALSLDDVVDSDAAKAHRADKKKEKREQKQKARKPHPATDDDADDDNAPPPQPPRTLDPVVVDGGESDDDGEPPAPQPAANVDGATKKAEDDEEEELDLSQKRAKKKSNKERKKAKEEEALKAEAAAMAKPPDNKVFAVSATSVNVNDEAWKQRTDIGIPKFSISTKGKTLFNDAELKIASGRRYGLVGPNGLGKSVLLRAIANGDLPIPPAIDSLYVEQEVMADQTPAIDVVLSADVKRAALIRREKEIFALIDAGEELDNAVHDELLAVTEELRATGADGAEAKALRLLRGLGFSEEMARSPTENLSGGWRMRVSIAKGLYLEPTLLLLDEPTNHLDLEAVIFLESVLSAWTKTLVVVSHDQDFLDEVCEEIIHLEGQKLWYFTGNYSSFEEQHSQHLDKRKKDWERAQKELKEQKNSKTHLTAAQRDNKLKDAIRKGHVGKGDDGVAIAAAGKNRGEKEAHAEMERPREYVVTFSFPEPTVLSPPIIQVRDVAFHYSNGPVLFKRLNFGLDMDSRICICGPNGSGKSTLIGLITQALLPVEGEVMINRQLRIASYKQHFVDALPLNLSPVEYLNMKHNVKEEDIRGRLGRYGLSGVAHKIRMASLSGGQKARVVFADMSYQNPHMLILDEPSNNLDMESIRALGVAITEFEGGVILVSHDTRLITETNMVLWVVERQTVLEQVGGIEAYRDEILEKLARQEAEAAERLKLKEAKALQAKQEKLAALEEKRQRQAKR